MVPGIKTFLTGHHFWTTVGSKQCFAPYLAPTPNFNDWKVETTQGGLSRCIASTEQLCRPLHPHLCNLIRRCARQGCSSTSPASPTPHVILGNVGMRSLLVGPYRDCTIRGWTFLATSPSGHRYADSESTRTFNYVLKCFYRSGTSTLCYDVEPSSPSTCKP